MEVQSCFVVVMLLCSQIPAITCGWKQYSQFITLYCKVAVSWNCPLTSAPEQCQQYTEVERVQPLRWWWILELLMECVECELSIGSVTSCLPDGRRPKLTIITLIISNAGPDAGAWGGPVHPTGIWGTWLVRSRTVRGPKGRFFRRGDTICWLSLSDFASSRYMKDFEETRLLTLVEAILLQHCVIKNIVLALYYQYQISCRSLPTKSCGKPVSCK